MHTDKFYPTPIEQLFQIIKNQLKNNEIFGIPKSLFYYPDSNHPYQSKLFGSKLATPIGVAAGPHTQMAQNIIAAWLCGARYIELKTIQTLDELEISKPCIDMQDEGYNCEWSQELKINQSYEEYLKAWILIHVLHNLLNFEGTPDVIFNMSVGYNLDGILNQNVQWFFQKMADSSVEKNQLIRRLERYYPQIHNISIPNCISNNITLSTMHGCPPDEIEKIGIYLIRDKKLHTLIKLNPTLLGNYELRKILYETLNFETIVPDEAFEHDLKYPDAVKLIKNLLIAASEENVFLGFKLTNTLESRNHKDIFNEKMMYMSGRALHPISINVARKLQNDFNGSLNLSFSAGADYYNLSNTLACGFKTITVCSDILKPGGYARIKQYINELDKSFKSLSAYNLEMFCINSANNSDYKSAILQNINLYADSVLTDNYYKRHGFFEPNIKTNRKLQNFDCISAPCMDACATNQDIPDYMNFTAQRKFDDAFEIILKKNPFPGSTGMVCDHQCQLKCTRINYDSPVLIREIKRFVEQQANENIKLKPAPKINIKVGIIGAGPSGLSCAFYLALAGFSVTVYESKSKSGGMVSAAIPSFRLTDNIITRDIERIENLGVKILYDIKISKQKFDEIRAENKYIYVGVGAQLSSQLQLDGIDSKGVIEPLEFLYKARANKNTGIGTNVCIIGGGNTAMDAARTAFRLVAYDGKVTIVYRRTKKEMPADLHEVIAVMEEGVEILELTAPEKVVTEDGRVVGLMVSKMKLGEKDAGGRAKPVKIENSEYFIPFDTIIPAIGQEFDIDFTELDSLKTSVGIYETKMKNIFIGGDALRGASTAINAIGDGRKTAEIIIGREMPEYQDTFIVNHKILSLEDLKKRKAERKNSVTVQEISLDNRKNFNIVTKTLTAEEAVYEASRCMLCDLLCNICVTVCPNLANYSYQIKPIKVFLQKGFVSDNQAKFISDKLVEIQQKYQIINIADWCNECGNCNTFCPASGAPYKEKPKLHLTLDSFENSPNGYFFQHTDGQRYIIAKFENELFTMKMKAGNYEFSCNKFYVELSAENFNVINYSIIEPTISEINLDKALEMRIIFDNIDI